ncbi:hypothetical protein B0H12DRAFT_1228915 [Mycena haematopus]|nr:hypothetical protein B0H12DRAFT_1228915 [Mycena haematopus]
MRFAVLTAVIALFATAVVASDLKNRQDCYPSYCNCNEDGCTSNSPACCANGSCPC